MSQEIRKQIDKLKNWKPLLNENHNSKLIPSTTNKYVYHKSSPYVRDKIAIEGLVPQEKGGGWLENTPIEGKVLFATNSDDPDKWFDSGYDDDVYKIDTTNLNNKWFLDPNFGVEGNQHIITFEPIPLSSMELIYKGTGEEFV